MKQLDLTDDEFDYIQGALEFDFHDHFTGDQLEEIQIAVFQKCGILEIIKSTYPKLNKHEAT